MRRLTRIGFLFGIGASVGYTAATLKENKFLFPTLRAEASTQIQIPSTVARYGAPTSVCMKVFDHYMVAYDRRCRVPLWVMEHLTPLILTGDANREDIDFYEDLSEHPFFRAYRSDYFRSGYDRGHMAAAGNYKHSLEACKHTFNMSNIAPQVGKGFNRDAWNDLEKYVRGIARKNRNTYVCTGPLYLPRKEENGKNYVTYEVIGNNSVAVPTHFFKVILYEACDGRFHLLSFILPNKSLPEKIKLNQFLVPVDAIERASGFQIFSELPRNVLTSVNKFI